MNTGKFIRLTWTFYKSFFLATSLITFCCCILFVEYGMSVFTSLFWLKAGTLAITYYFINNYKSKEYYYYRNLGISMAVMWWVIILVDFSVFLFLIITIFKLS